MKLKNFKTKKEAQQYLKEEKEIFKKKTVLKSEWYNLRPILGNFNWAIFAVLLGSRERGKSYAVTDFFCNQFINKHIPFVWIRLSQLQAEKLLKNNAEKLVDPDIRRRYNLDLYTRGNNVYHVLERKTNKDGKKIIVAKELMARVYDLSTFYSDKGSQYDKDFLTDLTMRYNIAIDEFEREKGERKTFDILYSLVNQLENIIRSTKQRTKIFFMGNTLTEASDILVAFNFIPEKPGIYKLVHNKKKLIEYLDRLKKCETPKQVRDLDAEFAGIDFGKRCVIESIENDEAYLNRRHGTIADILMPQASTFTNKIETDDSLICKDRKQKPVMIIKFQKDKRNWYTVWNSNLIAKWKGDKCNNVTAMRPYLDEKFYPDRQKSVILNFDTRSFKFTNLITFKQFESELELLKPRKG